MNTQTMTHICRHADRMCHRMAPRVRTASLPGRRQLFGLALSISLFPGLALAGTWASTVVPIGLASAITWSLGLLLAALAVDSAHRSRLIGLLTTGLLTMFLAIVGFSVAGEFIVLAVWILAGTAALLILSEWLRQVGR